MICRRLLLALAVSFVLSTWLSCLVLLHDQRQAFAPPVQHAGSSLLDFFRDRGGAMLGGQLALMALVAILWMWAERPSSGSAVPHARRGYNGHGRGTREPQ